jgi:GntR family transcriptional regulator
MPMLFTLDQQDPRPLYAQLVASVKEAVRRGELKAGDALPSVRELADELGINLHTVHRAYRELRDEGVVQLRLGSRARIAAPRPSPSRAEARERLSRPLEALVTEAFLLGLTREELHRLVDEFAGEKRPKGSR